MSRVAVKELKHRAAGYGYRLVPDDEYVERAAEWAAQWMRDHLSGHGSPNEEDLQEFKEDMKSALEEP
jgi:hypothetical protein